MKVYTTDIICTISLQRQRTFIRVHGLDIISAHTWQLMQNQPLLKRVHWFLVHLRTWILSSGLYVCLICLKWLYSLEYIDQSEMTMLFIWRKQPFFINTSNEVPLCSIYQVSTKGPNSNMLIITEMSCTILIQLWKWSCYSAELGWCDGASITKYNCINIDATSKTSLQLPTLFTTSHQHLTKIATSAASCFPGNDDSPYWEMYDFDTGMGFCFYPMTCQKHQGSHAEIIHFCTPLFCMIYVSVMAQIW